MQASYASHTCRKHTVVVLNCVYTKNIPRWWRDRRQWRRRAVNCWTTLHVWRPSWWAALSELATVVFLHLVKYFFEMFVLLTTSVYYSFFASIETLCQFVELAITFLKDVGLKLNKPFRYVGTVRAYGQVDIRYVRSAWGKWSNSFQGYCCLSFPAFQAALFVQLV